jgi:error-prone DNA polymerase
MIAVRGRIQREGEVVHLVAQRLTDLSADLASVGDRDIAFPLPHGRGDQVRNGCSARDPRDFPTRAPDGSRYDPYGQADQIRVKTRDFR